MVNAEKVRRALAIPPDALVVGHVGRFTAQKNHAFLVEIARELVRMESRSCFLLVGDGPLRAAIEAKVNGYSIEKHFLFAGLRSDVPALMKGAMDVFLFPSLYEGLGLALLEAQAAGLTSVVSDTVPGESDVIPSLVERLSLGNSASTWARALLAGARRTERPHSCQLIAGLAGRSIESSVASLISTYRTQRAVRAGKRKILLIPYVQFGTLVWLTWAVIIALRRIIAGDRSTILLVFLVFYAFFALPLLFDLVLGSSAYLAEPGFVYAERDDAVNVIYCLFIALVPLIWS